MPEYDGSIVIDTHIDTDNFDKDASKLFNKSKEVADSISSSFSNLKNVDLSKAIDIKSVSSKIAEIPKAFNNINIGNLSSGVSEASYEMQRLKMRLNGVIDAYDHLHNEIERLGRDTEAGKYFQNEERNLSNELKRLSIRKMLYEQTDLISKNEIKSIVNTQKAIDQLGNKIKDIIIKSEKLGEISFGDNNELQNLPSKLAKIEEKIISTKNNMIALGNELKTNYSAYSDTELKKLTSFYDTLQNTLNKLNIQKDIAIKDPANSIEQVKDMAKNLDEVANKTAKVSQEAKAIDIKSVSSAISQLPKELQNVEMKIFNISNAITYLKDNSKNLMGDFGGEVFNQLDSLQNKLVKLKLQKEILQSTPTISASDLSDARQAAGSLDEVANKTAKVSQEAKKTSVSFKDVAYSVGNRLSNAAKSSSSKMVSYFRNASSTIQGLFSPLSNIFSKILHRAKFILMGQLIRKVFQDVRQSFADLKEFGGPFAQSAQEITDAYKRATNAIATAFAPALQALAPIIVKISNVIVDFMNKVSMFTAVLFTGSKTVTIANTNFSGYSKTTAKATKNTKKNTKATKEQYKALAKFDKLDIFKQNKQPKIEAPAVEEPRPQALDMFKTVEVPNNILEFVQKVKDACQPLVDEFKYIGNSFMQNFAKPVSEHVKDNVLPRFLESTKQAVQNMDFSKLNSSLDHFFGTTSNITKDLFSGIEYGWERVILPLVTQYVTEDLPNFLDKVSDSTDGLHDTIQNSKEDLKNFLDFIRDISSPILKGFVDSMANTISGLIKILKVLIEVCAAIGRAYNGLPDWIKKFLEFSGHALFHSLVFSVAGPVGAGISIGADVAEAEKRASKEAKTLINNIKRTIPLFRYSASDEEIEEYIKKFKRGRARGFATGTVVSPNKEFLALLGDNTHEPEVVSPISTMKRAFVEAIGESNIAGNGNVTLQIDGKTFARLINPYIDSEKNRVGISMVQGVY